MTALVSLALSTGAAAADNDAEDAELAFFEYLGLLIETDEEWVDPLALDAQEEEDESVPIPARPDDAEKEKQ